MSSIVRLPKKPDDVTNINYFIVILNKIKS